MGNNLRLRNLATGIFASAFACTGISLHNNLSAAPMPAPTPSAFTMSLQAINLTDGMHLTANLSNTTRSGARLHFRNRDRVVFWATTSTGCTIWRDVSARATDQLDAMTLTDSETKTFSGFWKNYDSLAGEQRVVLHARLLSTPLINANDLSLGDHGMHIRMLPAPTDMAEIPRSASVCSAPSPTPIPTTDIRNIEGASDDVTPEPTPDESATPEPTSDDSASPNVDASSAPPADQSATPPAVTTPAAQSRSVKPAVVPVPGKRNATP